MYPNARNNPAGAIPVYIVAGPPGIPVVSRPAATLPNAGPIPVRVAAGPGAGGSDQGSNAGAIPVYYSAAPNAMPIYP